MSTPLITAKELQRLTAHRLSDAQAEAFVPYLEAAMLECGITSRRRRCAFLPQLVHESTGLTRWTEDLNYSAERLMVVFPTHFRDRESARAYAFKPERIANRVYASRGGNRDEASGDGWRYRGRGPIQITLPDNYKLYGRLIGVDLVAEPLLAADVRYGFRIAAHFWKHNGLNELADKLTLKKDSLADKQLITMITRRINGGRNGLAERIMLFQFATQVLHDDGPPAAAAPVSAAPEQTPAPAAESTEPAVDLFGAAVKSDSAKLAGKSLAGRLLKHCIAALTFFEAMSEAQKLGTIVVAVLLLAGASWVVYHNRKRLNLLLSKLIKVLK